MKRRRHDEGASFIERTCPQCGYCPPSRHGWWGVWAAVLVILAMAVVGTQSVGWYRYVSGLMALLWVGVHLSAWAMAAPGTSESEKSR